LDPNYSSIRSVTIRVGDEVEIRRGDFGHPNSQKGEKGKRHGEARGKSGLRAAVASVNTQSGHIMIEGVTHSKADGKDEGIPIHASNVVVVKIDDSDPLRLKKLQSLNGGDVE
jgi:ribosomal protein uL24